MGRDKARLRIGGRTLLAHIRKTALALQWPVRVIRHDQVPRCGPLGGIYTGLRSTLSERILFLACDMPCVSETLLKKVLERAGASGHAVFTFNHGRAGFPLLIHQNALPTVERLLAHQQFSLQNLSRALGARLYRPGLKFKAALTNVNTPEEWAEFQKGFVNKG